MIREQHGFSLGLGKKHGPNISRIRRNLRKRPGNIGFAMDDDWAVQAIFRLALLMRVIPIRSGLCRFPAVREIPTGLNVTLR
jgi:hypothetical protein